MTRQATAGARTSANHVNASLIPGRATSEATQLFASRFQGAFAADFYRSTASSLWVSSIGMGTSLGECDAAEDDRYVGVISAGIDAGLNLIDTGINYRCQRSERAVGRALKEAV